MIYNHLFNFCNLAKDYPPLIRAKCSKKFIWLWEKSYENTLHI